MRIPTSVPHPIEEEKSHPGRTAMSLLLLRCRSFSCYVLEWEGGSEQWEFSSMPQALDYAQSIVPDSTPIVIYGETDREILRSVISPQIASHYLIGSRTGR
jgi:hypothetical protein